MTAPANQKATRADHVVIDQVRGHLKCNHCGELLSLLLPMEISALVKLSKPFLAKHRGCPEARL